MMYFLLLRLCFLSVAIRTPCPRAAVPERWPRSGQPEVPIAIGMRAGVKRSLSRCVGRDGTAAESCTIAHSPHAFSPLWARANYLTFVAYFDS